MWWTRRAGRQRDLQCIHNIRPAIVLADPPSVSRMPLRVTVGMFVALTALLLLFVLYGAPLPEGDDGLIEAERRIRALSSERDKLSTE